jgi:hypothetical protein
MSNGAEWTVADENDFLCVVKKNHSQGIPVNLSSHNCKLAIGCVRETRAVRFSSRSEVCKKMQHDQALIT